MKIICIGRNYADHAKELGNAVPDAPVVFMKPASALLVNNKPFYIPDFTNDLHYEVEVVLKIGKNGKSVQKEFARGYYPEIGLGIDFTARDLQEELKAKRQPWELAKAFDYSAVIGDFVPVTDLNDPQNIEFSLEKNGQRVQHGFTKDLLFSFDELIVYVSKFFKLQMGDLIYTGTPAGVGPVQIGDELIGKLETTKGNKTMFTCSIH